MNGDLWTRAGTACLVDEPPRSPLYEFGKRLCDFTLAAAALLLLSPLFAVVSLAVWLGDFGPVLFVQTRVGRGGQPFRCYKFRTMVIGADALKQSLLQMNHHNNGVTFKIPLDPRITPLGRWLRKMSIDELPQLLNVLRGDMSLVGPRPPVPEEVERYSLTECQRLSVKPGLTCLWQINGRGDVPFDRQVEMDLDYINRRSLWLDLRILAATIPAVILCRGAY